MGRANYFACETVCLRGRRYSWRVGILALPTYIYRSHHLLYNRSRSSLACGDAEILDRGCENVSRRTLRLERQRDPATKNLTDAFASGSRSPHGARPPSISIWAASSEDRGKGFLRQAEVKSLTYISSILLSLWGNCLVKSLTCLRSHI